MIEGTLLAIQDNQLDFDPFCAVPVPVSGLLLIIL